MPKQQREPGRERERERERERQRGDRESRKAGGRVCSLLGQASSVRSMTSEELCLLSRNRAVESIMNWDLNVLAPHWLLSSCVVFNNVPIQFYRVLVTGKCGTRP